MQRQQNRNIQARHFLALAVVILSSLLIKIINEHSLPYWLDEGYTAWFANLSFHDIWFWLPEIEAHPPVYYSLVRLWGIVEADETGIWHRSLSIFISLLLIATTYVATRKVARYLQIDDARATLFNSILICFSPVIVWYSIEARPYILLFFAYSLTVLGLISILSDGEDDTLRGWVVFTFGAVLTNWSHHLGGIFSAVLFLSLFAHWTVERKFEKRFFLKILFCTIIVLAVSAPLIVQILKQLLYWQESSWVAEPTLTSFVQIMRRIFGFGYADKYMDVAFGGYSVVWAARIGLGILVSLVSGALVLLGLFKLVQQKRVSLACFFVLSCFAVPVISALISFLGPNIFLERTLLPGLIPYFLLLSISIEYIDKSTFRNAVKALYIVVIGLGLFATLRAAEKEPWDQIMASIDGEARENDVILLLPNDLYLPARLYVDETQLAAKIESVPAEYPAQTFSDFYPDGFPAVPGIRPEDADSIRSLIKGKDRVFLVTREEALFDPNHVTRSILAKEYASATVKQWDNIHVERFDRR